MSRPLPNKTRIAAVSVLVALLGLLSLAGCERTGTLPPTARRHTADPVQKVRAGVRSSEPEGAVSIPGEPGKLGPVRGRMGD
jgi:hypothetical protein